LWKGSRQSTTQLITSTSTLAQGGKRMNRKEIIFFDELGFGWIVDKAVIKKIHENTANEKLIVEKTLAELLRRP
jgi:hypothetical protein